MLKKTLVFGTGSGWRKISKLFDYSKLTVTAFVDNNRAKTGKKLNGKTIILPDQIGSYQYDHILIASQYYKEIIPQLIGLKVPAAKIMPFYESASLFKYDWLDYIDPKYWSDQIVIKQFDECEIEIARRIREKRTNEATYLFERYEKFCSNELKCVLLKLLFSLEDHQEDEKIKTVKELIENELIKQKFPLEFPQSSYTRIEFQKKMVPSLISVIIPVYKDVDGLEDTLSSLKNQILKSNEYEVIVVNDGADPAITSLCNDYGVQVISHKPNRGSYYARNRGVEKSRGEFLAFVDADIKVPVDWLEKGVKALREYDYVAGDIKIDETKVKTLTNYYELKTAFPVRDFFLGGHYGPTANVFVRRRVFEEIGGFDERLQSGGDREFGERIFRFTSFKQAFLKNIVVLHPPRDYKALVKKFNRIYNGYNDMVRLYPERFRLPKIRFLDLLKEFFSPPINVIRDKSYPFSYIRICLFYWWIKNVKTYKKMRCMRG